MKGTVQYLTKPLIIKVFTGLINSTNILFKTADKNTKYHISSTKQESTCREKLISLPEVSSSQPALEVYGTQLQYSCLENPMGGRAWQAAVHGVAGSQTRLSDFTFTLHFHALEKEMATHSSVLAWRKPGAGEPGGLTSMGSHRVGYD